MKDSFNIYKVFEETVSNHGLVKPCEHIIAGCSGGPDSVTLLLLLNRLAGQMNIRVSVACLNHGLRAEADREADFVRRLADRLRMDFYTKKVKLVKKDSLEQQARRQRISFFKEVAGKSKVSKVALGHNFDDVTETVLMRILKGTGLRGLRAIMPSVAIEGLTFIRPLLFIKRDEIISFLKENKVKYCVDSSNYSPEFFRNRIRNRLLPLIQKEYSPRIKEHLFNLYTESVYDYAFLEEEARKVFKKVCRVNKNGISVSVDKFNRLKMSQKALVFRLIYNALNQNLKGLEYKHFKYFYGFMESLRYNKTLEFPRGIRAFKTKNTVVFSKG